MTLIPVTVYVDAHVVDSVFGEVTASLKHRLALYLVADLLDRQFNAESFYPDRAEEILLETKFEIANELAEIEEKL